MSALHFIPPVPVIESIDELTATPSRPMAGRVRPLPPTRAPRPPLAPIGAETGIRTAPAMAFNAYGPTSHCSEAALFFAYRNADPDREIG